MGNVTSEDAGFTRLKDELTEIQHSIKTLSHSTPWGMYQQPLLPHQMYVDRSVLVTTRTGVNVLLGPVVGKVDFQSARILLEINQDAVVTCHVSTFDGITQQMVELVQCQTQMTCSAGKPMAFHIKNLLPGRQYKFCFGGIRREDVLPRIGTFTTPSLETGNSLRAVVVSGNNVFELQRGEVNLWRDVQHYIEEKRAHVVLHIGGQVVMQHMFDQSWSMLMQYANSRSFGNDWTALESQAMEILRSAYRSQWNLSPHMQFVLANASNLMMWSDQDVYPVFTTRREFYIDHEQPTIYMQVVRTVIRCARRLFHEYQRQLWDSNLNKVFERETELFSIAEKALVSTARVYQLLQQLPTVESELELQKKRRDIEGARRVEKQFHALQMEKARLEKQLVSFNQVLAPQPGEEFVYVIGQIAVLFLDMRSARLEPGGSQAAENELLSNLQWEFIENTLEIDSLQVLLLCSELPVVDVSDDEESIDDENSKSLVSIPSMNVATAQWKMRWSGNASAQRRLLTMLFDWKLLQPNREFVMLAGSNHLRFGAKTIVNDIKLRTIAHQYIVGPITAKPSDALMPQKTGFLHQRFELEHSELYCDEKAFSALSIDVREKEDGAFIVHDRLGMHRHDNELAKVTLGPVVGWVDADSAVILLEVDRDFDVVCIVVNMLTGETRRVFQHFQANQPNSFVLTLLRSEHFYQVSFGNIQQPKEFEATFTTTATFVRHLELLVLCNDENDSDPTAQLSLSTGKTSWSAIAQHTKNVPFSPLNLTLHLGGQFFSKENPFVQEALLACESCNITTPDEETSKIVYTKLHQMYRIAWTLPSVRESLAHGAHLILINDNDYLSNPDSTSAMYVQQCLNQVHNKYQNHLLPPSKRIKISRTASPSDQRTKLPISHVYGACGLFVLPTGDFGGVCVHKATWEALQSFLATPHLSVCALVTSEPILEDSPDDAIEKARFDSSYQRKFTFYRQDLAHLLQLLFEWKRPNTLTGIEAQESMKKDVILVSGSRFCTFDTIIQEVIASESPSLSLIQYVAGPLHMNQTVASSDRFPVFRQGTIFHKYTYKHTFLKKKASKKDKSQDAAYVSDSILEEPMHQFLHLTLRCEPNEFDIQAPLADEEKLSQPIGASSCSVVSFDSVDWQLPVDEASSAKLPMEQPQRSVSCYTVGNSNSNPLWELRRSQPAWLRKIISQTQTEEEELRINDLCDYLHTKESAMVVSFEQTPALTKAFVSLNSSDRTNCVRVLTDAFTAFYRTSGTGFRKKFPRPPSAFVITFTLQGMEQAVPTQKETLIMAGALEPAQYVAICRKSFVNAWLFDQRLRLNEN